MECYESLAIAGVQALQPYQPGKPENELKRELGLDKIIKLASNENPLGPDPRISHKLPSLFAELARYPDGSGFELKQALANRLNVRPEQITLGNGSNDILELVARVFLQPGRQAIMSNHAFAIYQLATQAVGADCVAANPTDGINGPLHGHNLQAMHELVSERTAVIFIANPNNPTGTYLPSKQLKSFIENLPENVICVVDEAYFEYVEADDYISAMDWIVDHPNLIITRTFSKAYGLAGLRIGYSVSSIEIADLLNRVRQPFNVNAFALAAARVSLLDDEYLSSSIKVNQKGLYQLGQGLNTLNLTFIPSVGNFICCDLERPSMPIYQSLLRRGVIVRPVENYQLPGYLRITIGTESEINFFLNALEMTLSE